MTRSLARVMLWLFVVFLGISFGAGLYEARIVVTRWIGTAGASGIHWNPEAARHDDTGHRFWAFVSTGSLTLLTIVNLIFAWRSPGPERAWWLAAAIFALADRLLTFCYFIPSMVQLMNLKDPMEAAQKAVTWVSFASPRLLGTRRAEIRSDW
jgi:hypothetical protein